MSCINPSDPIFQEILTRESNPILAELEYDSLYNGDDKLQFNRPETYQEQLDQFKERNSLVPVVKDGIAGYKMTMQGAYAMAKQYQKSGHLYNKLSLDYNKTSRILRIQPKEVVDQMQMNRATQEKTIAKEILEKTLQPIADKLSVKYEIISAEQAAEITREVKNKYNGESAFNLNGTAYIVDSAITLTNGIHEVIHPFIDAVAASNPDLFNKLYKDLTGTNTGAKLISMVRENYSDFNEIGQQKEVIVRALTKLATGNIESGEIIEVKGFFNKLWFAIKQLLRKVFGNTIKVVDLNEDTSLQQLADMLTGDTFKIDTKIVSEDNVLQFGREIVDTFNDISKLDNEHIDKTINSFSELIDSQIGKVLHNKSYTEIQQLSNTEAGRNQFANFKSLLNESKALGISEKDIKKKVGNLTYLITETRVITEKVLERLKEISKLPETGDTIQTTFYFKDILKDWSEFYENLTKNIVPSIVAGSQLYNEVIITKESINQSLKQINKINEPAMVSLLGEQLSYTRDNLKKEHENKISYLEEQLKNGHPELQRRIDDENEKWKKFDLSDENIVNYLQGLHGDANKWGGILESAISSSDPIVGGLANFIKSNHYNVGAKIRNISNDLANELATLFKAANVDKLVPSKLGTQLTFLDKRLSLEKGILKSKEDSNIISLLNNFKGYQYDIALLEHEIKAAKEKGDNVTITTLKQNLDNLNAAYMHRPYVDAYYKLQDIWKTPNGTIAKEKRQEIFDKIKLLEDRTNKTPEDVDEDLAAIDDLWREYKQLSSIMDLNGDLKDTSGVAIANVIQEYNKESRAFYEWNEKPGLFEEKLRQFKQSLEEDGINEGTEEYDDRIVDWKGENLRTVLKQNFFEDRQKILDRIEQILSKLPKDEKDKLDIKTQWEKIIAMTSGFRDEDGQPIGTDMTTEKIANIKKAQEEILQIQKRFAKLSGLSQEESDQLNDLFDSKAENGVSTEEERTQIAELMAKKKKTKELFNDFENAELTDLFNKLRDLQSKVPTEYYMDVLNNWLSKMNQPQVTNRTVKTILESNNINRLLELNDDFKEWFIKNHIKKEKWNSTTQELEPYFERLYAWNRIVPNDPKYYSTYTMSAGETVLGLPITKYYTRKVKDEFKTGYDPKTKQVNLIVGTHVSNKGNYSFLPINREEGATRPGWDDKYINKEYEALKASNSPIYKILQTVIKYHLNAQENAASSNKLWMDLPRFRMHTVEYGQSGKIKGDVSSKIDRAKEGVSNLFKTKNDDFSQGIGNYTEELEERLVNTDIYDNETVKIPIKGLSIIDIKDVSLDVVGSVLKYIESIETNKKLVEMDPVVQALMDILQDNGVKQIDGIIKKLFLNTGIKKLANDSKNERLQIVKNIYEKVWMGIENRNEMGTGYNKAIDTLMKFSAFGSLFVNVPGSIKNMFAAQIQGFIESLGGVHINANEYRKGLNMMTLKFVPAMISDYNKIGNHSYELQLMDMFDFVQGKTEEKLGHEYTSANAKNIVSGKFGFFGLAAGEMISQGGFGLGLMMHQKIKQTLPNGEIKEINYTDAFELKDAKVVLKGGIDKEWGEGGREFNQFKLLAHSLSEKLQGNYAKIDQPEIQRYTNGRLVNFMRRYFVPAFQNRFSEDRIQVGVANAREGYYRTSLHIAMDVIKDHKLNWNTYNDREKAAVYKTIGEIATSLMFYLLLRFVFGWDPNDKDKYAKLKDHDWVTNHAIYQLMMLKSESEQFIPIPGMGLDEITRLKNTPSIAFGHMDKWYKLLSDVTSPFDTYDKKSGFWDKGDNKLLVQMMKISGLTGNTIDPILGIKNTNSFQQRTK